MDQAGNGNYNAAVLEGVEERVWEGITSNELLCLLLVLPDVSNSDWCERIYVKGLLIPVHGVML